MSDSEAEIDYSEILNTLNSRNIFLKNEEATFKELKAEYNDALTEWQENRTIFSKMKEEFEIDQLEILKSNIILGDMRNQCIRQMETLQKLNREVDDLKSELLQKQVEFDSSCRMFNKKFDQISTDTNDETLEEKIQRKQCIIKSSQKEIEMLNNEIFCLLKKEIVSYDLKGMEKCTREIEENNKDYEVKLKRYQRLKNETNEMENLVKNFE